MKNRMEVLSSMRGPLAFFGSVVLALESTVAVAAAIKFTDTTHLLILYLSLLGAMVLVVFIVSFLVVRYPRQLLGEFEDVLGAIIQQLSPFEQATLMKVAE